MTDLRRQFDWRQVCFYRSDRRPTCLLTIYDRFLPLACVDQRVSRGILVQMDVSRNHRIMSRIIPTNADVQTYTATCASFVLDVVFDPQK